MPWLGMVLFRAILFGAAQFCPSYTNLRQPHIYNPLNAELNSICYLLALLAHHFLHVSRIWVKSLTLKLLMSYIYIWSAYS